MDKKRIRSDLCSTAAIILFIFSTLAFPFQDAEEQNLQVDMNSWLVLGPLPSPLPAFHEDSQNAYLPENLLKFHELNISDLMPEENDSVIWHDKTKHNWKKINAEQKFIRIPYQSDFLCTFVFATYLDVFQWTRADLAIKSPQIFTLFIDGQQISTKTKFNSSSRDTDQVPGRTLSRNLKLETGKHLIMIKFIHDPKVNPELIFKADLTLDPKFTSPPPVFSLSPQQRMNISHLLDGPKVVTASISPSGKFAALTFRKTLPPTDQSESWMQIHSLPDLSLHRTYRGGSSISSIIWAPKGNKFSYTTREGPKGSIWVNDLDKGTSIPVLKNIENLGTHIWSSDASFIIYSVTTEGREDRKGIKRILSPEDRQPGWRDRSHLFKLSFPDLVRQRLTAGSLSTNLNAIRQDSQKLLFTRSTVDLTQRPYSQTQLFVLDINSLKEDKIWEGAWFRNAEWGPEGKKILVLGGPSTFGETGINVPDDTIPNEYDTQAYIFDIKSKEAESLTKRFKPTVNQAFWDHKHNCVYLTATDRSYVRLYKYDLDKKIYSLIQTNVDVISRFDLSSETDTAVYTGSSVSEPQKAYFLDLKQNKSKLFIETEQESFQYVEMGDVKNWSFKNESGDEISGRIYFPPDFNPEKKYPCIVNYYGGTTPISRSFGGRYPLNLYAAQGYIVYVLQPSGAIGFGQNFSARHVNDWGLRVSDEIIQGVNKFLEEHPYVDEQRVGCIGASYGGFMTMLLVSKTNIFHTAIAHAGISSISSYWGEGYWGYSYSAVASANSFPWNRGDIYVEQSPLFNANKISTPLLLLHGSVDTNVPLGESTQLFTALKLLGRHVEYIQILDQNHHIMTYSRRVLWTKTIMAWFDRWLKRQPEWWLNLYPQE
ncbi:MAG: prolyl oligopeptidase family serine peptidase [Candidatus Aminicenantes bacterium]|nr:prolyl oligopeptidase family serine peptidase [Candidatus Aminicenantes bacterium]